MKTIALTALLATLTTTTLHAANTIDPKIEKYVQRSVTICPGSLVKLEPVPGIGPKGFSTYKATQTSSDTGCGKIIPVFVSPTTGQIIMADIFEIPTDVRPLENRISELAERLLKAKVQVAIDTKVFPDGVRRASIVRSTNYGPFAFHGWIDASGRFLLVGRRGNLDTDPGKTLLEALGVKTAGAYRGTSKAKLQIVELSDLQCPTCARVHEWMDPLIKKNTSKVSYIRLDLPLFNNHDWSIPASLGARAILKMAPSSYWKYVAFMFENQANVKRTNVDSIIKGFCEDHNIAWSKIDPLYRSQTETLKLLDQVSSAFDNGINGTPTFIVNGQFVHYGNDGSHLRKYIESAVSKAKKK